MSVPFQCPACLKQLIYNSGETAFLTCRHCSSSIIIPSTVIHQQEALDTAPSKYTLEEKRGLVIAEVQRELQAGRRASAVNVFSQAFNTDLAAAQEAVSLIEHGRPVPTEAIKHVPREIPVEERIYSTQLSKPGSSARSAPIIFWILLSIGIALAAIFMGDK